MSPAPVLACVVLAHGDPEHLRRLVAALDPFPVFLHCDSRTADDVFAAMTADLPDRVVLLPRRRTAWGRWGVVDAELDGYRRALDLTSATHVALLSGSDHPLVSSGAITAHLAAHEGRSIAASTPLPIPAWGHGGGSWRLRFAFAAWGKRPVPVSPPRRAPRGVVLAGGPQMKVLARHHAAAVLRVVDEHPALVRRWRRSWVPDETFVYSVLHTPRLVPGWEDERVPGSAWVIDWGEGGRPSPAWLTLDDAPALERARTAPADGAPKLFARKFSSATGAAVLDLLDRTSRREPAGSA